MITAIYIGSDRLDLFQDENIEIENSLAKIEDISANTDSVIRNFTVPASLTNNKIFKHYYDFTIDDGFDARIRAEARIELGGETFKEGKMSLTKVKIKKNNPDSYSLTFNGKLVTLKDKFKKDTLRDLDLSAYDHDYDSDTVKTGLRIGLFSGDLIYTPLVKKQLYINSDSGDNTQTQTLSNISYNGGDDTGIIWNTLRPSLRLFAIMEAIETKYSIEFSDDFFATTEFRELCLWLNNDEELLAGGAEQVVDFDSGDDTWMNLTTNIGSYPVFNTPASGDRRYFDMFFSVNPSSGYENVQYTVKMYRDGQVFAENIYTGFSTQQTQLIQDGDVTFSVYYTVTCSQEFKYNAGLQQQYRQSPLILLITEITLASENTIDSYFTVSENLPDIKVIDFFKGIVNMFKLVVIEQDNGITYVETIDNYYANGTIRDITDKIELEEYEVERGKILNEINFKYEEPQTILNEQFKENNGEAYGNLELYLYEDETQTTLLDGDALDIEIPFETILLERLTDINTSIQSQFMYGAVIDKNLNPVNPSAVIHYAENRTMGTVSIGFQNDAGNKELITKMWLPSHTFPIENPNFSLVFDAELNVWNGVVIQNTLYQNHFNQTISELFNIKKRQYKLTGKLPEYLLNSLRLNDVLKIKEDYFRINSFKVNLITGIVNFDLINSLSNTIGLLRVNTTSIYSDYTAKTEVISGSSLTGATDTKVDTGYGITWATVTVSAGQISIALSENDTEAVRDMFVTIDDGVTEINIYIYQSEELYLPTLNFSDYRNSQYLNLFI